MALRVPVTATGMPDWIRKCANAVNDLISRLGTAESKITDLDLRETDAETRLTALEGRADAVDGEITALQDRATALEAFQASFATLTNYADDAAAATGGVAVGGLYRNGSIVQVRVT